MAVSGQPDRFAHFVAAQDSVYARVVAELRRGRKESHWMWFVFPQLAGLGFSERSRCYALASKDEAARYAAHPLVGQRLRECTQIVNGISDRTVTEIFGPPDDMKFGSSMTLFEAAVPGEPMFSEALQRFFAGRRDHLTLGLLK
jgi:uncharacterized protein (DUF1810 family)